MSERTRWEYRHGELKQVTASDDLERELNALGAAGWELVDVRRTTHPIMNRRSRDAVAFTEAHDYSFIFKRRVEAPES